MIATDYSAGLLTVVRSEQPQLEFYIDQPTNWTELSRCVIVRGWCFGAKGSAINAVQLRSGTILLAGVTGLPRPDVKAELKHAPNENTGFEIRGTLPAGPAEVVIEVRLADSGWLSILKTDLWIRRNWAPRWLGGGGWTELMFFQMPAHMQHPPRPIRPDQYPALQSRLDERPKLSLVTPSYQQARYLRATLLGVMQQREAAVNFVVQDGASSDESPQIVRALAESRDHPVAITAWASEPDSGQSDAIARGFSKTSGRPSDLMAWINSDDFYLPGALAFVADYFARHPDVDVVYGHRILINEHSQEIGRWFLPPHNDDVLRLNDFVPQETLFWRRRIWDKVGGMDTSFKFAMDWDLLLRFQAAGARIIRVPYFLACFRIHPAQKTSAAMHDIGQTEINRLRERAQGRPFNPVELEKNPLLLRYLRHSACIEFLWRLGIRSR